MGGHKNKDLNPSNSSNENDIKERTHQLEQLIQKKVLQDSDVVNLQQLSLNLLNDYRKQTHMYKEERLLRKKAEENCAKERNVAEERLTLLTKSQGREEDLETRLTKYEAILFVRGKIDIGERDLAYAFNEQVYIIKMRSLYSDADEVELSQDNIHYKKIQFILNCVDERMDPRIKQFRKVFNTREKKHNLGLSLKSGYKVLSKDVHDELILLANKEFTNEFIKSTLKKLTKFADYQLKSICEFLYVIDHTPSSSFTLKTSPPADSPDVLKPLSSKSHLSKSTEDSSLMNCSAVTQSSKSTGDSSLMSCSAVTQSSKSSNSSLMRSCSAIAQSSKSTENSSLMRRCSAVTPSLKSAVDLSSMSSCSAVTQSSKFTRKSSLMRRGSAVTRSSKSTGNSSLMRSCSAVTKSLKCTGNSPLPVLGRAFIPVRLFFSFSRSRSVHQFFKNSVLFTTPFKSQISFRSNHLGLKRE